MWIWSGPDTQSPLSKPLTEFTAVELDEVAYRKDLPECVRRIVEDWEMLHELGPSVFRLCADEREGLIYVTPRKIHSYFDATYFPASVVTNPELKGSSVEPPSADGSYYRVGYVPYVNLGDHDIVLTNNAQDITTKIYEREDLGGLTGTELYAPTFPQAPWNEPTPTFSETTIPASTLYRELRILQVVTLSSAPDAEQKITRHPSEIGFAVSAEGFTSNFMSVAFD